jgi:hypothetical protein
MPGGAQWGRSPVRRVEQSRAGRQAGEVSGLGVLLRSPEAELGRGGGGGDGERSGGKPQVLEDGLGGGGAKDDGDDAAGASAAGAVEDVGLEGPPEEFGPGDGTPGRARTDGLGCQRARGCLGRWRNDGRRRHDARTHPGIGAKTPK